jgi:hypothetical protein
MAGKEPRNQALTAAMVGGAFGAAAAGAALTARAIARRNEAAEGKPINAVMKAAATACELNQRDATEDAAR